MNLLATKKGRLITFGGLYLSEGLPGGLLTIAIITEIQRRGFDTAAVGALSAALVLPWAWKFVMGPFVDNLHLKRFGARKQWIVTAQFFMISAMAIALFYMPDRFDVDQGDETGPIATFKAFFSSGFSIGLFAVLLFIHNSFAATQDVAIDALACQTLKQEERGVGNGIMFSCAHAGYFIGGSGALWMKGAFGSFELASVVILVLMAMIFTSVLLFVAEKSAAQEMADGEIAAPEPGDQGLKSVQDQLGDYFKTLGKYVLLTRNGFLTIVLAILPIGALAMSMLLSTIIAPKIGMTDNEIAALNLVSSLVFIAFCLLGGWMSDRFNRRLMFGISAALTIFPTLWVAHQFKEAGWAYEPKQGVDGNWPREEALMTIWWIGVLTYTVFHGFAFGVKNAFYMDIVTPKVAATQFTGLMALTNLTNGWSYLWQSQVWGDKGLNWPIWNMLYLDCALGLVFLVVLFFIRPESEKKKAAGPMEI